MPLVFKIVTSREWQSAEADGAFLGSGADRRDGFIHFSAAHQVQETLNRHFKNQSDLLLIAFEADALGPDLRWEVSRGGDRFPHLYGTLPTSLALWQRHIEQHADGTPHVADAWLAC